MAVGGPCKDAGCSPASIGIGEPEVSINSKSLHSRAAPDANVDDEFLAMSAFNIQNVDGDAQRGNLITSRCFTYFIYGAIFLNSLQLGACAGPSGKNIYCTASNHAFTFTFFMEMSLKLAYMKTAYFRTAWNLLDMSLVFLGIFEFIASKLVAPEAMSSIGTFKITRLFRVVRIVRVLGLKKELRMLVEGFVTSLRSLVWVSAFLFLLVYSTSIFCVEYFGTKHKEFPELPPRYFDTMWHSMATMFSIGTLVLWNEVVDPLLDPDPLVVIFLMAYVIISSFGVLNLIIGVLVDRTQQTAEELAKKEREIEKLEKIRKICRSAETIFQVGDKNSDGFMSLKEFETVDKRIFKELLADVELPSGFTVADLHLMLSQGGGLSKSIFVEGLSHLIHSSDFQRGCLIMLSMQQVKRVEDILLTQVDAQFQSMRAELLESLQNFATEISQAMAPRSNQDDHAGVPLTDIDMLFPEANVGMTDAQIRGKEPCAEQDGSKVPDVGETIVEAKNVEAEDKLAAVPSAQVDTLLQEVGKMREILAEQNRFVKEMSCIYKDLHIWRTELRAISDEFQASTRDLIKSMLGMEVALAANQHNMLSLNTYFQVGTEPAQYQDGFTTGRPSQLPPRPRFSMAAGTGEVPGVTCANDAPRQIRQREEENAKRPPPRTNGTSALPSLSKKSFIFSDGCCSSPR